MTLDRIGLALLVVCGMTLSCSPAPSDSPTFNRDIAPITLGVCSNCHRPGESAPFSLVTYREVKRRARQIAMVTSTRFMPPWLPEPGDHEFADNRRLTDGQIALIDRWYRQGTPEGDPADLPPTPLWTEGWQLGPPDLILNLPEPFVVPADGIDVFRNFVIPSTVDRTRFVRAVEFRPDNRRVVHHAIVKVDPTGVSRELDAADPGPGFDGMEVDHAITPDGHVIGWTPGRVPHEGSGETAWALSPADDVVVQLHMLPTGKPEPVRPQLGLYFAERPPTRRSSLITMSIENLDIPAGSDDYTRTVRFELPVGVEILLAYPHAHYLGKEIEAVATLPDGTVDRLLQIDRWDFNWQDDYRYASPVHLPAGTELTLRVVYDNSVANVRNPNRPPRRVTSGNRSTDEMGSLMLQVLTASEGDRARLEEAKARDFLADHPDSWNELSNLGVALVEQGRMFEAEAQFRRALELQPELELARYNLGLVLSAQGRIEDAIAEFERVVESNPANAPALNNLGHAMIGRRRFTAAIRFLQQALAIEPSFALAHFNIGVAHTMVEETSAAIAHYRECIRLQPDFAMAHNNPGTELHAGGDLVGAIDHYRRALEIDSNLQQARANLARATQERSR